MLPRALNIIGRTFVVLGAIMLLFVAFELWGTGIQQAQAQSGLEGDFQARLQQASAAGQGATADERAAPVTVAPSAASGDPGVVDTAASGPATTEGTGGDLDTAVRDPAPAPDGTDAPASPAAGRQPQPDASPLPERPEVPEVVRDISQQAAARATATALDPEVETLLPLLYPDAGEALGRITIPAIDVDEIVVVGVGTEDLRKGPGHYGSTPLPGQPGNAAIAGHRTTYGAPFGRIDELAPGDRIIVETLQGTFVYRVVQNSADLTGRAIGHRIVSPKAVEVLDDYGDNRLTLTSCHPRYSSKQRIVVQATLVGDPVVRLPRPGEPIGAAAALASDGADPTGAEPGDAGRDLDEVPDEADDTPGGAGSADEGEATGPQASDESEATGPQASDEGDGSSTGAPADDAPAADPEGTGSAPAEDPGGTDSAPAEVPGGDDLAGAVATQPSGAGSAAAEAPQTGDRPLPAAGTALDEAPARPASGFGQGLSGDRDAIGAAVLWGLAAAGVWYAGWMLGRSRRRWRAYAVAALPFLVVLYMTFSYIDRALPAY